MALELLGINPVSIVPRGTSVVFRSYTCQRVMKAFLKSSNALLDYPGLRGRMCLAYTCRTNMGVTGLKNSILLRRLILQTSAKKLKMFRPRIVYVLWLADQSGAQFSILSSTDAVIPNEAIAKPNYRSIPNVQVLLQILNTKVSSRWVGCRLCLYGQSSAITGWEVNQKG